MLLAVLYGLWWVFWAIGFYDLGDWALENVLVVVAVIGLWWTYPKIHFSNLSYTLITIFMMAHTVGSHYTYAEVPLGYWLQDALDLSRNHYDRIVHFSFGLLMFWPLREIAKQVIGAKRHWDDLIGLLFIISMSALYEAIEWLVATVIYPNSEVAIAFLGTQGDLFDAQKDHTLAITGALISFVIVKILAKADKLPEPS